MDEDEESIQPVTTEIITNHNEENQLPRPYVTLLSGAIAGITSTYTKQPLDRLKWLRQVSEGSSIISHDPYHKVAMNILRNEGFAGGFRGVTAACSRNMPHAAFIFTLYPIIEHQLISQTRLQSGALVHMLAGASASIIVTCITHPLDTLRVRYTVQYSSIVYTNYSQLIRQLLYTEGFSSFYRGLVVSLIGTIFRGGIGFGCYETLKSDQMKHWSTNVENPILKRLSLGFMSGIAATSMSYPYDTVRRRLQVWGINRTITVQESKTFGMQLLTNNNSNNKSQDFRLNARTLAMHIWQTEGFRGFFKGLSMTMVKTPISTAVSLTVNDVVKKMCGVNS